MALTDGSGTVTATYAYDAFGAVRSQTGSATNPWRFTGQQLDAESSLYFLRARYYDPSTGRFLGRDPLSASVNPYSYADNNPVNATDPSGMVATPPGDANLGYPVISDVGGSAASKEGGQMPSYADCQNQTNPLWLFCPSALIRLANGAIIELPPWERSLLDGLAGLDSGGDAAFAKGDGTGSGDSEFIDPERIRIPGPTNSKFGKLDYLLGRVIGNQDSVGKGKFFAVMMGFTDDSLARALRAHLVGNASSLARQGNRIVAVGEMTGPSGLTRVVTSVWQRPADGFIDLITAIPRDVTR